MCGAACRVRAEPRRSSAAWPRPFQVKWRMQGGELEAIIPSTPPFFPAGHLCGPPPPPTPSSLRVSFVPPTRFHASDAQVRGPGGYRRPYVWRPGRRCAPCSRRRAVHQSVGASAAAGRGGPVAAAAGRGRGARGVGSVGLRMLRVVDLSKRLLRPDCGARGVGGWLERAMLSTPPLHPPGQHHSPTHPAPS
eukprot:365060-Chlamydomonas_euryale.AAC.3